METVEYESTRYSLYHMKVWINTSAATMTKKALLYLRNDERLKAINPNHKSHGVSMQIHDEVIIQVPVGYRELGEQILKEAMEKAAHDSVKKIPFTIEPEVMERWEAE